MTLSWRNCKRKYKLHHADPRSSHHVSQFWLNICRVTWFDWAIERNSIAWVLWLIKNVGFNFRIFQYFSIVNLPFFALLHMCIASINKQTWIIKFVFLLTVIYGVISRFTNIRWLGVNNKQKRRREIYISPPERMCLWINCCRLGRARIFFVKKSPV